MTEDTAAALLRVKRTKLEFSRCPRLDSWEAQAHDLLYQSIGYEPCCSVQGGQLRCPRFNSNGIFNYWGHVKTLWALRNSEPGPFKTKNSCCCYFCHAQYRPTHLILKLTIGLNCARLKIMHLSKYIKAIKKTSFNCLLNNIKKPVLPAVVI